MYIQTKCLLPKPFLLPLLLEQRIPPFDPCGFHFNSAIGCQARSSDLGSKGAVHVQPRHLLQEWLALHPSDTHPFREGGIRDRLLHQGCTIKVLVI